MRTKILTFISALLIVIISSCGEKGDLGAPQAGSEDALAGSTFTLDSFGSIDIPEDDCWVITDSEATTSDFAGLRFALLYAMEYGREIALEFPNLVTFPKNALYSFNITIFANTAVRSIVAPKATEIGADAFYACSAIESVSMPEVVTIGANAFSGSTFPQTMMSLRSVNFPNVTTVGDSAFFNCVALESVYLATNDDVKLMSLGTDFAEVFLQVDLSKVTLQLGSANRSMVDGLYLNAPCGEETYRCGPFKSIKVL